MGKYGTGWHYFEDRKEHSQQLQETFQCYTGVLWHAMAVSFQPLKAVRSPEPKREPKGSAYRHTRVG